MKITAIGFENFRNLQDFKIFPHPEVNVIYGNNAQGKSNILEAIWMFNGVRSFRGAKDQELVQFKKPFSKIELDFFTEERNQNAKIDIINGKREAYLNGVKKDAPSALLGKITSIVFYPDHLSLIKDGPSERRKFLDSAICQFMPRYAMILLKYNKILNQRNALLKDIPYHSELIDTLEIWDEKMAAMGAMLIYERITYIKLLKEKAKEFHLGISNGKEQLKLKYSCGYRLPKDIGSAKEIESILLEKIKKHRADDLQFKYTSVGPHRDDIEILINKVNARKFASQGQQRSAVLSLKLAEATIVDEITDEKPVILLDDVLSELDRERQNFLMNKIRHWQVFITCCEMNITEYLEIGKLFFIEDGKIYEKDNKR